MSPTIPTVVSDPFRLEALANYAILDTPAEPGFDDIVHLACQLCAVPVALVSLVAEDRQWFKARVGFPACETDLNSSVCAHALAEPNAVLIIPDLTLDARTSANPLVTGEPFIRFYAGAPLVTPEGLAIGSLCVIDKVSRPGGLTDAQVSSLQALARQVVTQLELRKGVMLRDTLRAEEARAFRGREALRDTQAALEAVDGDLGTTLQLVVDGAMQAVPAAEGAVVELIDGAELEYRAVRGTLIEHQGLRVPIKGSAAGHCASTCTPCRIVDVATDPHVHRQMAARLKLCSAVMTPIVQNNVVVGVLKLQSSQPEAFTHRDLELIALFGGLATTSLNEFDSRAKDAYWRGMFNRLTEGFIVGEVVRDDGGKITDWRFVEVNPAWSALLGIDASDVVGRTVRDVIPGIEDAWIEEVAEVIETGEPAFFTRQIGALRRWYEGRVFKLDRARFGVMFLEVTSRIESEGRRNALLALGDRLRDLTTIPDIIQAADELVGRTLGATRAGFGRIEGDVEFVDIERDWTAPGMASIAGRHRFDDYGDIRAHLRRGEALVINDVATDPRTRADPAPMLAIGITALVNMPVRERGRAVAVLIVHDAAARVWTSEEIAFLRNVADRVEAGVARVRAEDQQTVLNHELAHRLKNTLAIVQSIGWQTLRGVTEQDLVQAFDRRVLALSRAHDVLLQKSWSAARMRAVMESVLTMQVDLDRFAFEGPDLNISPQAAQSLSLLLHELTTNAIKYGALSTSGGKVRVAWRTEDNQIPTLVLGWNESGGPTVTAPQGRGGFGSKLIRMGLMGTKKTDLNFKAGGLQAEFRAPLDAFEVRVQ